MKKPNHSNDNQGQNYDPATGKYIADSESAENPIDEILAESGLDGDFSGFDWDSLIDEAEKEASEESKPDLLDAETEKNVDDWMKKNNIKDEDRKGIIGCLKKMNPALMSAYCKAILSNNELTGTPFFVKKATRSAYCLDYKNGQYREYMKICKGDVKFGGKIETPYESFFHELGHLIDYRQAGKKVLSYGGESYNASFGLADSMKSDVSAIGGANGLRKRINEYVQNYVDAKKEQCGNSLEALAVAEIAFRSIYVACDFMNFLENNNGNKRFRSWYKDPFTGETAKTEGFGHTANYFKKNSSSVEIWAEMCEAEAVSPEGMEFIKKNLPNTHESFIKRLEKIK